MCCLLGIHCRGEASPTLRVAHASALIMPRTPPRPFFLSHMITPQVDLLVRIRLLTLHCFSPPSDMLHERAQIAGKLMRPHLPELLGTALEAMSSLEAAELQYLQVREEALVGTHYVLFL